MASSRRSRVSTATGRSRTGGGRRTAVAAAQSSGNQMMIFGGIAAAIGLVLIINFVVLGSDDKDKPPAEKPNAQAPAEQPKKPTNRPVPAANERAGKTPDRPAPKITAEKLGAAEAHFNAAKAKWNEGLKAKNTGDTAGYTAAIRAAWDEMQKLDAAIEEYSTWYEEADLGGWTMPGEYVALASRFNEWDKMTAQIQKVKTR